LTTLNNYFLFSGFPLPAYAGTGSAGMTTKKAGIKTKKRDNNNKKNL